VTRGDRVAVERVGVGDEVAELGEGVASDAGDRRAPAAVLVDEVLDDLSAETVFEVEDVGNIRWKSRTWRTVAGADAICSVFLTKVAIG